MQSLPINTYQTIRQDNTTCIEINKNITQILEQDVVQQNIKDMLNSNIQVRKKNVRARLGLHAFSPYKIRATERKNERMTRLFKN